MNNNTKQAAYELLVPAHARLLDWAKDKVSENGTKTRPSEFKEEFTFGRMEPGQFGAA